MTAHRSVKELRLGSVVGVVGSAADLDLALRMRKPPDFFEMRLDSLAGLVDQVERQLSLASAKGWNRPGEAARLIITARHPREGGANNLSPGRRRELLVRFLPWASFVDVELRSASVFRKVLETAHKKNVRLIISVHNFASTPGLRSLCAMARRAKSLGADIFKIATRTDTPDQVTRLLDFAKNKDVDLALSVSGVGKLGRRVRRHFIREGSVLNYAGIDRATVPGQPTLSEIRRWTLSVGR
jgi:3-dehydroquinate dehydratase-1